MIIVQFAMKGEKEIGEWDGRPVKLIETAKMRRKMLMVSFLNCDSYG
jgi:hypothetical protein